MMVRLMDIAFHFKQKSGGEKLKITITTIRYQERPIANLFSLKKVPGARLELAQEYNLPTDFKSKLNDFRNCATIFSVALLPRHLGTF